MRHIVKTGFAAAALAIVGVQYLSHRPAAPAAPPVPPAPRQNVQLAPAMQPVAPTVQPPQANLVAPQQRSPQEPIQIYRRPSQN